MRKLNYRHTILFIFLLSSFLNQYAQPFLIKGRFPGQSGKKLFITYSLTGVGKLSSTKDSCTLNGAGEFIFKHNYKDPIAVSIYFDFNSGFEFLTDRETVSIEVKDKVVPFSFLNIKAISPANKQFDKYNVFISPERRPLDSLYNLRDKFRENKKRDSMKALEPALIIADSLLLVKNYKYVSNPKMTLLSGQLYYTGKEYS